MIWANVAFAVGLLLATLSIVFGFGAAVSGVPRLTAWAGLGLLLGAAMAVAAAGHPLS
jgi:hypothetical protein